MEETAEVEVVARAEDNLLPKNLAVRAAACSGAGPILQTSVPPITTALLYSEVTETICRLPEITLSYEAKRY